MGNRGASLCANVCVDALCRGWKLRVKRAPALQAWAVPRRASGSSGSLSGGDVLPARQWARRACLKNAESFCQLLRRKVLQYLQKMCKSTSNLYAYLRVFPVILEK